MSRFIFLDRDGTLVRDTGYPHRKADYALLPGVTDGLRALAARGFRLAIVTNQSGLGRGLFTEADYHAFHALLCADLARAGVELTAHFFCPHTPADGCACRKPRPGLLLRARDELGAQLAESFLIGDSPRDAQAAHNAGCRGSVLISSNAGGGDDGAGGDGGGGDGDDGGGTGDAGGDGDAGDGRHGGDGVGVGDGGGGGSDGDGGGGDAGDGGTGSGDGGSDGDGGGGDGGDRGGDDGSGGDRGGDGGAGDGLPRGAVRVADFPAAVAHILARA